MKEMFREFYHKEEIDFRNLSEDTLIVIDANVLLHIFRFSIESRKKLFNSLEKVSDNLWVPYIAALEFHFNKQSVIRGIKIKKKNFGNKLEKSIPKLTNVFNEEMDNFGSLIRSTDENEVRKNIKESFNEKLNKFVNSFIRNEVEKEFSLIGDVDDTSNHLAELMLAKIGATPSQNYIDSIENEGIKRYAIEFPPGYMDEGEKGDEIRKYGEIEYHTKFGDLLIWKDIIGKAKEGGYSKVIFVSDDLKEDWIYETKGEKVGPRAELKKELYDESNADLYTMGSARFISEVTGEEQDTNITKTTHYYSQHSYLNLNNELLNNFSQIPLFELNETDSEITDRFDQFTLFDSGSVIENEESEEFYTQHDHDRYLKELNDTNKECNKLNWQIRELRNRLYKGKDINNKRLGFVRKLIKMELELQSLKGDLVGDEARNNKDFGRTLITKFYNIKLNFENLILNPDNSNFY
ncbi:PIN-like domain-containing protein [Enterococcus malodoratus]|uniref:PIN like domain-containing protein n=1 Tax=Enterococcus malodoratus ATCC 43197 TaxID=1158601 RepID=R2QKB1_9ENTE|nr:PIN-like domain-containing protein [Enterococcus malodoratus]EOH72105.1 hypothetical protein UAI_04389 [Enterococcus malodoratus ATCC 43197]EOT69871.1 hypothetical protein I585_01350 [Enterococcus malodoratus ATCC 43197]OJG56487.1 hypothetical protein RV07_GL004116 [Enterococcus malodoratus]SPX01496.1 Uncharacterised protein [Enterococcus malodoratus]STC70772.1 Uncharacterised protein [Enterococcus malodoratus]